MIDEKGLHFPSISLRLGERKKSSIHLHTEINALFPGIKEQHDYCKNPGSVYAIELQGEETHQENPRTAMAGSLITASANLPKIFREKLNSCPAFFCKV